MKCLAILPVFLSVLIAQTPTPTPTPGPAKTPAPASAPKGPDKEIAEKVALLKECVLDRKCERDQEGLGIIDALQQKQQAGGLDPKDKQAIVKALEHVLTSGKVRPHDQTNLYVGAAAALGYCGPDGAKVLKAAYVDKRFPDKKEWVRLREHFLKNLGRTKDESMVKFLCNEARRSPEFSLSAFAGEALGNFDESKEAIRKEIVSELMIKYGELSELASQLGTNVQAQNAQDQLAAVADKWNSTLGKMTRQNITSFRDWQTWYNKHKNQPW